MAPQELKNNILHDLGAMSMVSVLPTSKTADLVLSKRQSISRLNNKKMIYENEKKI